MVRRHVLAALARGIAAGDDDAARTALAHVDWLVRRAARRSLERALIDAALATGELGGGATTDADAQRHTMRVAALAVRGTPAADASDRARVEAAYEATLPAPRISRAPVITLAAAAVALGAVGGIAAYIETRPPRPSRVYTPPVVAPSPTAFRDGGVPVRDATVDAALTGPLISLVLAVDHDDDASVRLRGELARQLLAVPAFSAHGVALEKAWRELIADLELWPTASINPATVQVATDVLAGAARTLSEQLAGAGIGDFLEGDVVAGVTRPQVLVHVYAVERVVFVTTGSTPRRVLDLRRRDDLNYKHALLGMQSTELGGPVVLLEAIDRNVVTELWPVLVPDAELALADASWSPYPQAHALVAAAGAAVRTELVHALGGDADDAGHAATLLVERAKLVQTWRDELARKNLVFVETDDLYLPPSLIEWLTPVIASNELKRALAIDDELQDLEAARLAARLHDLDAATVRRHEAQHGLDDDRDGQLRYPQPLVDLLGPATRDDGTPRDSVVHARAELAAYLSQIANDPITPQLALWNLAAHAFSRSSWGRPESYAAVIVLDGIARHLGGGDHPALVHEGEIDRDRLAAVAQPIAHAGDDKLRAAAAALWVELYGEAIVPITDRH